MGLGLTVREAAAQLDRYGLINVEEVTARLTEDPLDEDLEWFGYSRSEAILMMLIDLRVAVIVTCDRVIVDEGYREALEDLAACTEGAIAVTDVRLDRDASLLLFRANGVDQEWNVDIKERYLDQLTFVENVDTLTPPGSRVWGQAMHPETYENYFVLGEPDGLRRLAADFDIDMFIYGDKDGNGSKDHGASLRARTAECPPSFNEGRQRPRRRRSSPRRVPNGEGRPAGSRAPGRAPQAS